MKDPAVRKDGKCARCGKQRVMPTKERYAPLEVYEAEPFCSRTCCEKHYDTASNNRSSGTGPGKTLRATTLRTKKAA